MILFGSGSMFAKPVSGNLGANPTPMAIGVLQDCAIDISREVKELYGQNQMPVAIAPAKHKFTAKAKFASFYGKQLTDLLFGQTTSTGYKSVAIGVSGTVPTTPFQLTPTVPASGTFVEDQGVTYSTTGLPLTRVPSAPTVGQYSVNEGTGIYTFAAADTAAVVLMNFVYSVAASGISMTFANQVMGYGPIFEVTLLVAYNNQSALLRIFNCVANKFTFPTKNDDFVVPDFEFMAFANAAGNVFEINYTQ